MTDDARQPFVAAHEAPALIEVTGGTCGWAKTDLDGDAYPCEKPATKRLINATEMWGGPEGMDCCAYHAPRALKCVLAEIKRDRETWF